MRNTYLLLLLSVSHILWANTYSPVNHFTEHNGLTHSSVTCLYQDYSNYLWIGTENGLSRFDGYRFNTYYSDYSDTTSLTGSHVLDLFQDHNGDLWCLTDVALNRKKAFSGEFKAHILYASDSSKVPLKLKAAALDWRNNSILLLSTHNLHLLDISSGMIRKLRAPQNLFEDKLLDEASIKYCASLNSYFISNNNLYYQYIVSSDTLVTADIQINDIMPGRDADIYFREHDGMLFYVSEKNLYKANSDLSSERIEFTLAQDEYIIDALSSKQHGTLLVLTNFGLYKYIAETGSAERLFNYNLNNNFSNEISRCLLMSPGVFWVATPHGLFQYNLHQNRFKTISHDEVFNRRGNFTSGCYTQTGQLFLASSKEELAAFGNRHLVNRKHSVYSSESVIYKMFNSSEQESVYGVTETGIYNYTPNNYNGLHASKVFNSSSFKATPGNEDTLWAVTTSQIVCLSATNTFERKYIDIPVQYSEGVIDLFQSGNCVYLLQKYRVIKYHIGTRKFDVLSLQDLNLKLVPQNTCFLALNSVEVLLGTTHGLFVLYPDKSVLPTILNKQLLKEHIVTVYAAASNHIFIATNNSLCVYNRSEDAIVTFDMAEGLPKLEYVTNGVIRLPEGELCFIGKKNIALFHPDSLIKPSFIPGADISAFSIIRGKNSEYRPLFGNDTVHVISNYRLLRFYCTALDFVAPEKNHFQYSFEPTGKPDNWHKIGAGNTFFESKIQTGYYMLKVKASDSSLHWNHNSRELVVHIVSSVWRSRLAIIIYILILLLLFYFTIFLTTRNLRQRNKRYKEREQIAKKVEHQKEELSQKNKNITDSLNYAKRIQIALMPSQRLFASKFPDSFILHIPKDIVSGDFYWINEVEGRTYFAAVDCTGHGVPGAFMSIIGFELFRRITEQEKIKEPAEILNQLSRGFETIFRDIDNITVRDGMDVAFCAIDPERKVLEYAGAFNPLYLVRDNTISEIKGDRFSVGLNVLDDGPPQEFKGHKINLQEGDIIYIFTDGYADQFGGPEGKKYKYRRFRHLLLALHQLPMNRQVEFLQRSIMDWKGSLDQVDDILVMGIRISQAKG